MRAFLSFQSQVKHFTSAFTLGTDISAKLLGDEEDVLSETSEQTTSCYQLNMG